MSLSVSGLYVYPLKSARGIALERAEVQSRGLRDDRRWMAVDAQGEFLSQRDLPQMARIEVALDNGELQLDCDGHGSLSVPRGGGEECKVRVWGDQVAAESCSADADRWLSGLLGEPCRLVYMPDRIERQIDRLYAEPGEIVSFADGFPLLLIGQGSLDGLNARLAQPVPMDRFRPNVVIAGGEPHVEDGWLQIRAGGIELALPKPCSRCAIPGIDQRSGERAREPLPTLSRYRRQDHEIWFGQNAIARSLGALSVGDAVEVLETRPTPRPHFGG